MAICLNFDDLVQIGQPRLAQMMEIGNAFPGGDSPEACEAFSRQVRLLEGVITQTYTVAVSIAKKTEDLNEVANVWERMGKFCSDSLQALSGLKEKYPYCGTPQLYDLALDYKLACQKRQRGVLEEIECQKQNLPRDLFPAVS